MESPISAPRSDQCTRVWRHTGEGGKGFAHLDEDHVLPLLSLKILLPMYTSSSSSDVTFLTHPRRGARKGADAKVGGEVIVAMDADVSRASP